MFGVLVPVELGSLVPVPLRYLNYLDFDFSNFGPNLVADWAVCEDPFRLFRGTGYYFQDYIILKIWKRNFVFILTVISICILVWCIICGSGCWSLGWLRLETRIFFWKYTINNSLLCIFLKYFFYYLYNLVGRLDLFHLRMSRNKIVELIHFHLQLMASQLLAWELKNESVVEHV